MNVFELIYEDDLVSLTCLIAILYLVGTNMANANIRVWGWRAAGIAYVVFVACACSRLAPTGAYDLVCIAFRGLFASGLTVGCFWIILGLGSFLWNEMPNVERRIIVRPARTESAPPLKELNQEQSDREERERQKQLDMAKCEELRLECELLYRSYSDQLQGVLPPEQFGVLLDSYLSGQSDPKVVRKRTRMIKKMVEDQVSAAETLDKARFESLRELAEHFAKYRREVEQLPYDEDTIESFLVALNDNETKAMETFFQGDIR